MSLKLIKVELFAVVDLVYPSLGRYRSLIVGAKFSKCKEFRTGIFQDTL